MLMRTDTRLTVMRMPGDAMIKFEYRMIDEETNDSSQTIIVQVSATEDSDGKAARGSS